MRDFSKNQQYGNVGNAGDVLKHFVLVNLLVAVKESLKPKENLHYVAPFAFRPSAPCSWEEWERHAERLLPSGGSHHWYQSIEAARAAKKLEYLCSVGLALELLGGVASKLIVAEQRPAERQELESTVCHVYESAHKLVKALPSSLLDSGPVVALIDPFKFDERPRRVALGFLNAVKGRPWAVALFDSTEEGLDHRFGTVFGDCLIGLRTEPTGKGRKVHVALAASHQLRELVGQVAGGCGLDVAIVADYA